MKTLFDIPTSIESQYKGAGYALAAERDGELTAIVYFCDFIIEFDPHNNSDVINAFDDARTKPVVERLSKQGNVFVGMCSGNSFIVL